MAKTGKSCSTSKATKKKEAIKNVSFSFYAPEAGGVAVAGTFNEWDMTKTRLKKDKKGMWKATLRLKPGRYEYRYRVDEKWENDQGPVPSIVNPFGTTNNVVEV